MCVNKGLPWGSLPMPRARPRSSCFYLWDVKQKRFFVSVAAPTYRMKSGSLSSPVEGDDPVHGVIAGHVRRKDDVWKLEVAGDDPGPPPVAAATGK